MIWKKAIAYYQKAVDQGHYGAMNNLGVCYKEEQESGFGFWSRAFELFVKASEGGDCFSYINLARCYLFGQGTAIDLSKAKIWVKKP